MSSPLVSDAQLNSLRESMAHGYQTSVKIYSRTSAENPYSDDAENFTLSATVLGWLRSQPDIKLSEPSRAVVHPEETRLFVPVGTVIERGDQVEVDGERYTVIDTNASNTWKVALRVALKRAQ